MTVGIANRQSRESLSALAGELGDTVTPQRISEALGADMIALSSRDWSPKTSPRSSRRRTPGAVALRE
jgi:predicted dinucleotide-binding enzyme